MVWALRQIAQTGRIKLEAAHVHHGLRSDSDHELEEVRKWADGWSIPLHVRHLELDPYGAGLQATARLERYQALFAVARSQGCPLVATGHNRDDQIETVLMRILRGAGVRGLRGILPRTRDGRIRPLLGLHRSIIEDVLVEHDLASVRDPSNHDESYMRTRIRHRLIPSLRSADRVVPDRLLDIAEQAQDLWSAVEEDLSAVICGRALPLTTLRSLPDFAWGAALGRWLGVEFEQKHVAAIRKISAVENPGARTSAPGSATVHRVGEYLVAGPRSGPADYAEAFRGLVPLGRYLSQLTPPTALKGAEWRTAHDGTKQRFRERMRRLGVPDALRPIWPALWSRDGVIGLLGETIVTEMCGIRVPRDLFK
jgi:tRNA(Ile)-lysidine synthetase-like protein